jgi:hypothetical protein
MDNENKPTGCIELAGKLYEPAENLRKRVRIGETALGRYVRNKGMPSPIKIAGRRYFDREEVDRWLLRRK